MSVITKRYRQTTYGDIYTIEYHPQSDRTIKMFCFDHPDNPFSADVTKCHLYPSGAICVSEGNEPRTMDRATAIATFWMDGYSKYIRSGEFPNGAAKVNV